MKKIQISSVFVLSLLTIGTVFASGPIAPFDDVEDGAWYEESVEMLWRMGVVNGYSDGTYRPEDMVNRAEMAEMIYGLYTYVQSPKGEDWSVYNTTDYSIWYPSSGTYSDGGSEGCFSGLMGEGDYEWMVSCYDLGEMTMETYLDDQWDHLEDDEISQTQLQFDVNGQEATRVTTTILSGESIFTTDMVFIENEDTLFVLSGEWSPSFEVYVRSFKIAE